MDKDITTLIKSGAASGLKAVEIRDGAVDCLKPLVGGRFALVVSDENCLKAGASALSRIGACETLVFQKGVRADETAVETVRRALLDVEVIVALGSGTITDICRYSAAAANLPFISVPTAPSMDGYASSYAAMLFSGTRAPYPAKFPEAIVADTRILCSAPRRMITAGLGELLGAYPRLLDWKLDSLINGGDYCDEVAALVRAAVEDCFNTLTAANLYAPEGAGALARALIISGARASGVKTGGSARHISRYIEMQRIFKKRPVPLYGEAVAVGALTLCGLYPLVAARVRSRMNIAVSFSQKIWEQTVKEKYGPAASKLIKSERTLKRNSGEKRRARINKIYASAPQILEHLTADAVPDAVLNAYGALGGVTDYPQLSLTLKDVKDAVLYAKELRAVYTILQMASDLNLLTGFAASLTKKEKREL
ncbi:MAG: iron-containing alcohol dehydrogenase [Clostridiales bacterium]|jgi:glycerol-1-phosphate dehydrogenase [NAD(P)+]|nr:iron-containing alcohol dehydrogenase [Clostridiales bacterium]